MGLGFTFGFGFRVYVWIWVCHSAHASHSLPLCPAGAGDKTSGEGCSFIAQKSSCNFSIQVKACLADGQRERALKLLKIAKNFRAKIRWGWVMGWRGEEVCVLFIGKL